MWFSLIGRFPTGMILICTILSFVIPFGVHWIYKELHTYGDPPWKQDPAVEEHKDPHSNNSG
ncbi:hypothetical protein GC098_13370 [Paenibacillus sp. LMG 31458]|uniref:Uncharacterized protein n=1 Tax=Paenibacillus phytorum TaxID=2654977 RepID=A0ABX1XVH2_9BACL|nr:hypothetical protein [Paenibacillus phytorum]NOU72404.1 hypothetical protein [Paenibacillus phytorum]